MNFVIGYAAGQIVTFLVLYAGFRRAERHEKADNHNLFR
jgi:hypothetical protein